MVQSIDEFASYRLVDAAKGNLDIPEIENDEEKTEEAKKDLEEVSLPFPSSPSFSSFSSSSFVFGEIVTFVERLVSRLYCDERIAFVPLRACLLGSLSIGCVKNGGRGRGGVVVVLMNRDW